MHNHTMPTLSKYELVMHVCINSKFVTEYEKRDHFVTKNFLF